MDIAGLLMEFGQATGLGELQFNEEGVARVVFDDELEVDFERVPGRDGLFLHAVVGLLPAQIEAEALKDLLAANLFGTRTGGATLSLDRSRGELMLHRELPEEGLDYPAFASILEHFLAALQRWQSWVISGAARVSMPDAAAIDPRYMIRG